MEALDRLIKAGKVRALGASAIGCLIADCSEKNGWTQFSSMQNHYNLLYREDKRALIPICRAQKVSLAPYSPLAAGRLSLLEWKTDMLRYEQCGSFASM